MKDRFRAGIGKICDSEFYQTGVLGIVERSNMSEQGKNLTKKVLTAVTTAAFAAQAVSCAQGYVAPEPGSNQPGNNTTELNPTPTRTGYEIQKQTIDSFVGTHPEYAGREMFAINVFITDKEVETVVMTATEEEKKEINKPDYTFNGTALQPYDEAVVWTTKITKDGGKEWVRLAGVWFPTEDESIKTAWYYSPDVPDAFNETVQQINFTQVVFAFDSKDTQFIFNPVNEYDPWTDYQPYAIDMFAEESGINKVLFAPMPVPEVVNAELTSSNLENQKWGDFSFVKSEEGYYEMKDAQGNIVPEVKFFEDGTAEKTAKINGKNEVLTVAFQVITQTDGKLILGLWEFENGVWSEALTNPAPKSIEEVQTYHKLAIIQGHEKEQAMIKTVFHARNMAFSSENYDPKSEFEDISVTYNFETIDNFDVRPKSWRIINWGRAEEGAYRFQARSRSNLGYDDLTSLAYARPMQAALGTGWFNLDIYNADGTLQPDTIHAGIVAMNTDGSLIIMSGIIRQSMLNFLTLPLTKISRGNSYFWLISQPLDPSKYRSTDKEYFEFLVKVNRDFFSTVRMPELDEDMKMNSLPSELDRVFIPLFIW